MKETEEQAHKQRFGLFSFPVSTAIGDDSYDKKKLPLKDENGKVKTQPPNVKASATMTGKTAKSFFSQQGFTTIGDLYIDPERKQRIYEMKIKALSQTADGQKKEIFKPASGYKTLVKAAFDHKPDYEVKEKNFRDAEGKVIVPPSNIKVSLHNKQLDKYRPWQPEPYDRFKDLQS